MAYGTRPKLRAEAAQFTNTGLPPRRTFSIQRPRPFREKLRTSLSQFPVPVSNEVQAI
jgi:hypothetical protein